MAVLERRTEKVHAVPPPLARRLAVIAVAGAALLFASSASAATPAEQGKQTFEQTCSGCHTIGGGKLVGPDLEGVVGRLGAAAVTAFITDPQKERPGTAMPNLGLEVGQIAAIVAYLGSTGGGAPPPPPTDTTPAAAAGSAAKGKSLFTGTKQFENGGPPCLSCHTIAGIGPLGGGALGPDLTKAYAKLGVGAAGFVGPTMAPIFGDQPLTAPERAALAAFLEDASTKERPGSAVWALALLALGGLALLVIVAVLIWPRRGLSVRRPLVDTAKTGRG
jgi:mono/diheme cytochrome c family protein